MKARFTKGKLVYQLLARAAKAKNYRKFDANNGWAQLCPRNCTEPEAARIALAVEYGQWVATRDIAREIDTEGLGS